MFRFVWFLLLMHLETIRTCNFLTVSANNGLSLVTDDVVQDDAPNSLDIGILCDSEYFQSEGDTFWDLSRAFWIVSVTLGSLCTILACALSTFVPPSDANWKALSIGTALSAVLQVPIFLIFEADPCSDYDEHNCTVSLGVFMLIGSTIIWVAVTLLTQCVDPPRWAIELDAWKVQKRQEELNAQQPNAFTEDDDGMEELLIMQQYSMRSKKTSPKFVDAALGWLHKRRWANSPDLPVAVTESASNDEEVRALENGGVYPGIGSYYADSNNSRLVLKVTPDGKRIGDDQRSVTTFGDLNDFMQLSEDNWFPPSPPGSNVMSDESDVETDSKLLGEELVQSDNDHFVGVKGVAKIAPPPQQTTAERAIGQDEENPPTAIYTDEPIMFTDPKAFRKSKLVKEGFVPDNPETSKDKRIISGIRALTVRMKRDVSRRMNNGNTYAVMDDESWRSQSTLTQEIKDCNLDSKNSSRETTSGSSSPGDNTKSCLNGKLMREWTTLFADANPGVMVANSAHSSSEDDPEGVNSSSEGTASFSLLSFGAQSADNDDDSSSLSSASMSDASDSEVQIDFTMRSRQRRDRHRRRQIRRTRSAGNSVASRTSLLDTTIDEETDFDLREFESSDDEGNMKPDVILENPHPLTRTKSAPDMGLANSELSSKWMHGADSHSLSGYEHRILHKRRLRQQVISNMSSAESEVEEALSDMDESTNSSMSGNELRDLHKHRLRQQAVSSQSSYETEGQQVVSLTDETTASGGDISSYNIKLEGYDASTDDDNHDPSIRNRRRCRSLSVRRRRNRRNFRYDRLFRDGIHSPSVGVVTDSESSQEHFSSEASAESRSARSTISRRARRARVRRLQVETEEKINERRRARTLDPPKNRWRGMSPNRCDQSRIGIKIAPLDVEEYGSDEASL